MQRDISKQEDTLRSEFNEALRLTLEDTERTILQRIDALRELEIGPSLSWFGRYRGPGLFALGIVCGLIAVIVSTA